MGGFGLKMRKKKKISKKKKSWNGYNCTQHSELYTGKEHEGALILRNEAHLHLNKVHRAFSYIYVLLSLNFEQGGGLITLTIDNSENSTRKLDNICKGIMQNSNNNNYLSFQVCHGKCQKLNWKVKL